MTYQMKPVAALIAGAFALSPAFAAEPEPKIDHSAGRQMHGQMDHGDHCGMLMGEGVINAVDVKKSKVTITHKPIEALSWDEMTMDFAVLKPVDLAAFAPGERVHFMLKEEKSDAYAITMMCALDVDESAHAACMAHMRDAAMKRAADSGKLCPMEGMEHGDMGKRDGDAKRDHSGHN